MKQIDSGTPVIRCFLTTDDYLSHLKKKRTVKPVDTSIDYELPFEWEAWLRWRRRDPPTQEEIQARIARQAQAIANAKRVDAVRFAYMISSGAFGLIISVFFST